MTTIDARHRLAIAHRLVVLGMLIGLVWKWSFFVFSDEIYHEIRLQDTFFPNLLQQPDTLRWAYLVTLGSLLGGLIWTDMNLKRASSWVSLFCTSVLCLHQGSYNDMTFVTTWWCGVWSVWFTHRIGTDEPKRLLEKAAFLSRLILSVVLLGGAAGKWTQEYWSGDVLYEIYFRRFDFWCFNWLREWLDPESIRMVATWYSRQVVLVETVAGIGLWMLPPRWAATVAIAIFASIVLFSNYLLLSVVGPLIGLATVGWVCFPKHGFPLPTNRERFVLQKRASDARA